jgi:hypothetical protein
LGDVGNDGRMIDEERVTESPMKEELVTKNLD